MRKKTREVKHYLDARPRIERWLLCQKIGKTFYDSNLSFERLQDILEYFQRSDFLKEEVFNPKLK